MDWITSSLNKVVTGAVAKSVHGAIRRGLRCKQARSWNILRQVEVDIFMLKKGALDRLRLPVDVAEGHLGRFILEIPGTQILSSPSKITIEDLYLLVVPSAGRQHDPGEDEKRMQAAKQERLDSYETLQAQSVAATQIQAGGGDEKTQNAMEIAMTQKIADNLQVYVKNIHIRYEDDVSCPGHPFAAGITLGSFEVETTDKNWMQAFITEKIQSLELHKLAKLNSLSAYFDTDEKSISGLSVEESKATFKSLCRRTQPYPSIHTSTCFWRSSPYFQPSRHQHNPSL
ncbi:hypothetical protein M407DRAFT_31847 [Tulasnella calospora MUT 4182]|uniref:Chorein N-terminal domain-containing protein n=1 Tax=Tulasnella calospora MUT 4182 TaxID=1051891 RepID=A0A0C3LAK7_9AGAM|nr:hypothetical protein M407DRAFT_31847 [Tulasnella calospora MUT 4182]